MDGTVSGRFNIELLNDHPSSSDEFDGRSHDRLATAIVDIISQNVGGRAIGLEGAWGSGKSTVIDIAAQKLTTHTNKNGDRYLVVNFDAWAHQDDPIRAVFLQEFTEKIVSIPSVDKAVWDGFLNRLKEKKKTTTEDIRDHLSWVTTIAILVLPLYPIAFAALKEANSFGAISVPYWFESAKSEFLWSSIPISWLLCVALFAPHIACAITWLSWRKTPNPFKKLRLNIWSSLKEWASERKQEYVGKSIVRLYSKETEHRTIDQTIYEVEATTNDFNLAFDQLVKEAASKGYRLVIVLDNLDRLPKEIIRATWATMRNFFAATPGTDRSSTLKNVWLIVPFDKTHIEKVFEEQEEKEQTKGFIEKTFEIVLRVSPPLLDDYRGYFISNFSKVFGEQFSTNEREGVFRLFDIYYTQRERQITPRTIKNFINLIASQIRQWGSEIPIRYQALYVLLRDELSMSPNALRNENLIDVRTRNFLGDPDWQRYLAAAHFNVELQKAYQFLLGPAIKNALTQKNVAALQSLQRNPGFDSVLHDIILGEAEEWAANEPVTFCSVSAIVDELTFVDESIGSHIWRYLDHAAQKISGMLNDEVDTCLGMTALLKHSSDPIEKAQLFTSNLANKYKPDPASVDAGVKWFKAIEMIKGQLQKQSSTTNTLKVPVLADDRFVIGVAASCSTSKVLSFSEFDLTAGADVAALYGAEISNPEGPGELFLAAMAPLETANRIRHPLVIDAITKRLNENNPALNLNQSEVIIDMVVGMLPTQQKSYRALINALYSTGALHGLLAQANRDQRISLQAKIVALMIAIEKLKLISEQPSNPVYGSLEETNTILTTMLTKPDDSDPRLLDYVAKIVCGMRLVAAVMSAALPPEADTEFYRNLFRRCVNENINELSALTVLTKFDRVSEILDDEGADKFIRDFDRWSEYVLDNLKDEKILHLSSDFHVRSIRLTTKIGGMLSQYVPECLKSVSKDKWAKSLVSEDDYLRLLVNCLNLGTPPNLGSKFADALADHFNAVLTGTPLPKKYRDRWHMLTDCLSKEGRTTLFSNMRDNLVTKGPSIAAMINILDLYGQGIVAEERLNDDADRVARFIISPLVSALTADSIRILSQFSSQFSACLEGAAQSTRQTLQERLSELISQQGNESHQVAEIASLLGIKILPVAEKTEIVDPAQPEEREDE